MPAEGLRFTYKVRPTKTGLLPTNTSAVAQYTAEGKRYEFIFPIPEVLVIDNSPTITPPVNRTPTATSSAPRRVFLPILMRDQCLPKHRERGVDVILVMDTSSSMKGEKLAAAIAAGQEFLDGVDPARDRVGLVSFDEIGRREQALHARSRRSTQQAQRALDRRRHAHRSGPGTHAL